MTAIDDTPVVVVNAEGFLTFVNRAFTEVFGWTSDEAVGKPLSIIIPERLQDAHNVGFSRFLATEESRILGLALELQAVGADLVEFPATHYIIGEADDDGWRFAATISPI